ncbi:DUF2279 domain-containing protein [Rhodoferax sp.]|uniref:DUF2279 domain-containing protein n=1 Tax=Rhodoferax sp. TaxID=50421 RepID=UPI0027571EED|nr:DUF2279 domain-containing protein [Rhodoferax sp.]
MVKMINVDHNLPPRVVSLGVPRLCLALCLLIAPLALAQRSNASASAEALEWVAPTQPSGVVSRFALGATDGVSDAPSLALKARDPFRTAVLVAASVGLTAAYGKAHWWQDGFSGQFKTVNEGWFGPGTANGGADKLGHAMFSYTGTRLLTRAFEWAGHDPGNALKLGLLTSVGTLMGVELLDGYSKQWRFSKEDAILNLAGGALAYWLETHRGADALIDFRLQYSRSTGPQGRRSFSPFGDYSGQRYLVVFKASGVPVLRQQPILRYLEFNLGYGARNFETESAGLLAPTRHAYYGVSLDLAELMRATVYRGNTSPSLSQRVSEAFFEYVQVPGATAQGDQVIR